MAAAQDAHESLRERTRRALLDNPDPALLAASPQPQPQPQAQQAVPVSASQPVAGSAAPAGEIERRLRAIRLVRDLEPKRACYAGMVQDLARSLTQLAGDSIHYRAVLDKLQQAHADWQALEAQLGEAYHTLRSTQWLVDLLADPTPDSPEEPS